MVVSLFCRRNSASTLRCSRNIVNVGIRLPDPIMSNNEELNPIATDGLPARGSGDWIRRKHHYLARYCAITATGMKNKFCERVFVGRYHHCLRTDACAGVNGHGHCGIAFRDRGGD